MQSLTERDYELLSSYIDGELSDAERAALEIRLNAEDELRRELASLRQTVALVNQLPKLKAPRNFTLDKPVAQTRTIPFPMTAAFSALSAAAAVLLIVFGGYLLTFSGSSPATSAVQIESQPGQVAQVPTSMSDPQDSVENSQAATDERELMYGTQSQEALESAVVGESEEPQEDALSFAIAAPTMTEIAQTAIGGQGSAGADQAEETDFFAMPAGTQLPPSAAMDAAAPMIMQQTAESTAEAQDNATANSAAGLAIPASPPSSTSTPLPTAVAELQTSDGTVQRAAATESPVPPPQPTLIPQQKIGAELGSSTIGSVSIIVGIVFLIAALVTTLARRRRKVA